MGLKEAGDCSCLDSQVINLVTFNWAFKVSDFVATPEVDQSNVNLANSQCSETNYSKVHKNCI